MAKSLSTNSNFCHGSARSDLEEGINFSPSNVSLPLEIISNILSRLPAKSILRFRCVCKQWRSLLTDDYQFITRHYNESLKRRILIPTFARQPTKVPLYTLGPSGEIKDISVPLKFKFSGQVTFSFGNPVNGLFHTRGFLLNPFTRDVVRLPESRRHYKLVRLICTGLGFDESLTGCYKLVRLISTGYLSRCACEVLTVGTQEWRYVGNTPCMRPFGYAVFLNGAVHWLAYSSYEPLHLSIFTFDIKHEKFQLTSIPVAFPAYTPINSVTLQELGGYLCLLWEYRVGGSFQLFFLRIWMLKDYDKSEWEEEYNIDLSNWVKQWHFEFYATQIVEVRDGKLLIQNFGNIYAYDFQSKFLSEPSSIPGNWSGTSSGNCMRCHVITESLISPKKLLKQ